MAAELRGESSPDGFSAGSWLDPRHRLTPLETCIGWPLGADPAVPPLPEPDGRSPRVVLDDIALAALQREPCMIAFSGGRDSSAILAVATHVARREGLPLPIPITNRFPEADETDESSWQELVIGHLGLDEWVRLSWVDELDVVGPYAQRVLLRHGPLFPHNAHFIEPLLERASGGSLLSGTGGDELFGPSQRQLARNLIYLRRRPRLRSVGSLALELAPYRVRWAQEAHRSRFLEYHWLWARVRRVIARQAAADRAGFPLRWDRAFAVVWRRRFLRCLLATRRAMGIAHGVASEVPFLDPRLLSAYAAAGGPTGLGGRRRMLSGLVGDLLPEALLRRTSKALFDQPFFNRHSKAFAADWGGEGVDQTMVDADALRTEWLSTPPAPTTAVLMQRAWLAGGSGGRVSVP